MRLTLVFIATAIICAAISYLLTRARMKNNGPVARPIAKPAESGQVAQRAKAAEKAGLKRGYISHDGKNFHVDVTLNVLRRCKAGDLDLIKMDIEHSKVKRFVLSIEGLGADSTFTPRVSVVSAEEILHGFSRSFDIPQTASAQTLGIYLCKDSTSAKRCATKLLADYNGAFMEYSLKREELAKTEAPDRVYFFQMIHVSNDGDLAVFERGKVTDENFAALPEYLAIDASPDEKKHVGDDVARVKKLTRSVGSLPVQTALGITIDLPMLDAATCEQK